MKSKACAIEEKGGKTEVFFMQGASVKNEVLARITDCAIVRGDIQIIDNNWGDTKLPAVPGHEIIGIVEEAGSEVTGVKIGDRVGIDYQQTQRTIYRNYTGSRCDMDGHDSPYSET